MLSIDAGVKYATKRGWRGLDDEKRGEDKGRLLVDMTVPESHGGLGFAWGLETGNSENK